MFVPKGNWDSPLLAYTSGKVYYRASGEEEKASRTVLENEIAYVEEITAVMQRRKGEEKNLHTHNRKYRHHFHISKTAVELEKEKRNRNLCYLKDIPLLLKDTTVCINWISTMK